MTGPDDFRERRKRKYVDSPTNKRARRRLADSNLMSMTIDSREFVDEDHEIKKTENAYCGLKRKILQLI